MNYFFEIVRMHCRRGLDFNLDFAIWNVAAHNPTGATSRTTTMSTKFTPHECSLDATIDESWNPTLQPSTKESQGQIPSAQVFEDLIEPESLKIYKKLEDPALLEDLPIYRAGIDKFASLPCYAVSPTLSDLSELTDMNLLFEILLYDFGLSDDPEIRRLRALAESACLFGQGYLDRLAEVRRAEVCEREERASANRRSGHEKVRQRNAPKRQRNAEAKRLAALRNANRQIFAKRQEKLAMPPLITGEGDQ